VKGNFQQSHWENLQKSFLSQRSTIEAFSSLLAIVTAGAHLMAFLSIDEFSHRSKYRLIAQLMSSSTRSHSSRAQIFHEKSITPSKPSKQSTRKGFEIPNDFYEAEKYVKNRSLQRKDFKLLNIFKTNASSFFST
jgi:hypothetical protein